MFFSALDIGTKQIKAIVAEIKKDGQIDLLASFKFPSAGMRKGEPVDVESLTKAVSVPMMAIRGVNKNATKNVFVGVSGSNVRLCESRGIVAVSRADSEIYQEDLERVLKACQAVNWGHNRMVLHTLTKQYIVDGEGGIISPLGMIGNRLEVESILVDAFKPNVNAVTKSVEAFGSRLVSPIYSPLAAARAVISKTQRELGVVMIDIGFGTTSVVAYEDDQLLCAKVFPIGAGHITNDIAIGLKCPVESAEEIKLVFGCANPKEISPKDKINLEEITENLSGEVSRKLIAEIIESRISEIFELVNNELKIIGKAGKLPAGAILVGAPAKMPGLTDLARIELKLSVQIGVPEIPNIDLINAEVRTQIEDPEFSVAAGLLLRGRDHFCESMGLGQDKFSIKKIFHAFLP